VDIHRAHRRHGVTDDDFAHAVERSVVVVDLKPDADPPSCSSPGADRAGYLLEAIVLELAADRLLAIHAMPSRPSYHDVLPPGED
jgi:hypothetical protein